MNIKPSWDTTGDLLEAVDPRPKEKPLFEYKHAYTERMIECRSIQEFDLNVLVQINKDGLRTVSENVIYQGKDISGFYAIPLLDQRLVITGYHLLNKKSQPTRIKVGTGIPVLNHDNKNSPSFIATDNLSLFLRLSQLKYVSVYHSDIYKAFDWIDLYLDESKPRIIATNKDLETNADLQVYFNDVTNLTDQEIKSVILTKAGSIQPVQVKSTATLNIINMSDIQAQPITWLWDGWLPLGKMTILAGAGGCGKTNLTLALIATITTGGVFPDGSQCSNVGKVLIYSTEDDPADTLKPRLIANGADITKVSIISGRTNEKGELEPFDPAQDFPKIEEYIKLNPDVKLLMIDPIISAVSGDMNKANDVRRSLQPLVDLANEYKFSVLGITHFAKGTSGSSPADRIIGSQAFTALARMAWSAAKREDEGDCILVRAKSNNSILEGGVRYQIEAETVLGNIETTKTAWLGVIEGTARELLNEAECAETYNSAFDEAKDFLTDLLSPVESMPSKEVKQQVKEAGLSMRTIERVSAELKIKRFRPQGETGWHWKLPDFHKDVPPVLPEHKQHY